MSLGMFKKKSSKGPSGGGVGRDALGPLPSTINTSPQLQPTPKFSSKSAGSRPNSNGGDSSTLLSPSSANGKVHLDDWGRAISPAPAFRSDAEDGDTEMQLLYGYTVLHTTTELSISAVDLLVSKCAQEIMTRGLDTPLILSSTALDTSLEGTSSLIRSYMSDPMRWAYDLNLAAPLDVGTFMKWGLARLVNEKGGRGFLSWDSYNEFKVGEKTTAYQPRYCSASLIARLPKSSAHLLSTLLTMFSSVAAHSVNNGMTPRRLAALFSPYCFGLPDDLPFDETYREWQKATDAFEHVLLSFIRGQEAQGRLPTHLEKFIKGYPQVLNISYSTNSVPKVPRGGRVEEVTRVKRLARFHSRNLVASASSWEVPHCPDWSLFFPPPSSSPNPNSPPSTVFTPFYRHLLNIRSGVDGNEDDEGEVQRYKSVVDKEWSKFGEMGFKSVDPQKLEFDLSESQRNRTRAKHSTMDWGTFEQSGFGGRETFSSADLIFRTTLTQSVQSSLASQQALDQRLRQTEKMLPAFPYDVTPHEQSRILVDVNFFEVWADVLVAGGWAREELKESSFALLQWKCRARDGELAKGRAVGAEDDRTEERWVLVEEYVPREYREELRDGKKKSSKRMSFMRSVKRKKESPPPRLNVNQISYPTSTLTNTSPSTISAPYTTPSITRKVDESVFAPGPGGDTRLLTLSNVNVNSSYAPSFVSSTGAGHGHGVSSSVDENYDEFGYHPTSAPPPVPSGYPMSLAPVVSPAAPVSSNSGSLSPNPGYPPVSLAHGIPGTISSQKRESAFKSSGGRGPVGYVKPSKTGGGGGGGGFLARIASRKTNKTPSPTSPYGFAAALPQTLESNESYDIVSKNVSNVELNPPPPPPPPLVPIPPIPSQSPPSNHPYAIATSPPLDVPPPPTPPKPYFPSPTLDQHPNRASEYTVSTNTEDDDPYGGMDEEEDEDEVQEGTVLFRGSRAYPQGLGLSSDHGHGGNSSQEGEGMPPALGMGVAAPARVAVPEILVSRQQPNQQQQQQQQLPVVRPLPTPPSSATQSQSRIPVPIKSAGSYPYRYDSLPPSPKPDADTPVDETNRSRDRFLSGASGYSTNASRVSELAGRFENREGDVRLTQYGFGGQGPV